MVKRKAPSPPPEPHRQPHRSAKGKEPAREESVAGLSVMSTATAGSTEWQSLLASANERIDRYVETKEKDEDKLLKDGLKALLEWLPEGGRESVARDVADTDTDQALFDVFRNLLTCLVSPLKSSSAVASTSSPHPRRISNAEAVASVLDEPEKRDEGFRSACLHRDGHRCVMSGVLEYDEWESRGLREDEDAGFVEAAHVIPYAYSSWHNTPKGPPDDVAKRWEALYRCFPSIRHLGLNSERINDPSNGITLADSIHKAFGKFFFAFKPTDTPNQYELKTYRKCPSTVRQCFPASSLVKLKQAEGSENVKLPAVELLDCHYRLSEVLNATGMGEYVEMKSNEWRRFRDGAGSGHLREDGGSDFGLVLQLGLWQQVEA